MSRQCGDCQLCCKLTPVVEMRPGRSFLKVANQKCPYQRVGKGCIEYTNIKKRPRACFVWRCRWLMSDEGTEDLPRPDRAGYVIDEAPDMITLRDETTGVEKHRAAIQVWVGSDLSKKMPRSLKRYMEHMGAKGYAIICRFDEKRAMVSTIVDGHWGHQIHEASIVNAPADIASVWREHGLA